MPQPLGGIISWRLRVILPPAPALPRRGAFAKGSVPHVDGGTVLRLRRPIRLSSQASGCRPGSPPSSSPPPFTSCEKRPVFGVEASNGMREVACCWRPRPRSAASQSAYRGGQVDLSGRGTADHCAGPSSCLVPTMWGVTGWHHRQGMPGAPFPVGLCTLRVMHPVMPQPRTTSWGLPSQGSGMASAPCSQNRTCTFPFIRLKPLTGRVKDPSAVRPPAGCTRLQSRRFPAQLQGMFHGPLARSLRQRGRAPQGHKATDMCRPCWVDSTLGLVPRHRRAVGALSRRVLLHPVSIP